MSRTSQTVVALNSKPTNVDYLSFTFDGSFAAKEGAPIVRNASGGAAQPAGAATSMQTVYVNFVDSGRSDVSASQGDPFNTADKVYIETGGLTGIVGQNTSVGLPAACWDGGALPSVGQAVYVDATSKLWKSKTAAAGELYYGTVEYVTGGRAFFMFSSTPRILAIA